MEYTKIQIGDSVIVQDCTSIHPELHDGAGGRIVGEADDNGDYLVDFWFTRKRINPSQFKQYLPKLEVVEPIKEVETMSSLQVKFKRLSPSAVMPKYAREGDCGMDLTAVSSFIDEFGNYCYDTQIAIQVPKGYVGLLYPRSSLSKYGLIMCNHVGVIEPSYSGPLIFKFRASTPSPKIFAIGERIGQLVIAPCPKLELVEVDELEETARGSQGFGSTGA